MIFQFSEEPAGRELKLRRHLTAAKHQQPVFEPGVAQFLLDCDPAAALEALGEQPLAPRVGPD